MEKIGLGWFHVAEVLPSKLLGNTTSEKRLTHIPNNIWHLQRKTCRLTGWFQIKEKWTSQKNHTTNGKPQDEHYLKETEWASNIAKVLQMGSNKLCNLTYRAYKKYKKSQFISETGGKKIGS